MANEALKTDYALRRAIGQQEGHTAWPTPGQKLFAKGLPNIIKTLWQIRRERTVNGQKSIKLNQRRGGFQRMSIAKSKFGCYDVR